MTAKKDIIKALRQELKDLETEMANYKQGMRTREKWFSRVLRTHEQELALINVQTNNLASDLHYRFDKQLTWLELSDDQESKFQVLKYVVSALKRTASPIEIEDEYE